MNVKVQTFKDFPYFCFIFVNHMYAEFVDSTCHVCQLGTPCLWTWNKKAFLLASGKAFFVSAVFFIRSVRRPVWLPAGW